MGGPWGSGRMHRAGGEGKREQLSAGGQGKSNSWKILMQSLRTSSHTDRHEVTAWGICSGHMGAKAEQMKKRMWGEHLVRISGLKCSVWACNWRRDFGEGKMTKRD